MEVLLVILFVIVVIYLVNRSGGPGPSRGTERGGSAVPPQPQLPKQTYRPSPRARPKPSIVFRTPTSDGGAPRAAIAELSGLRDAVTGTCLDPSRGLYRCGRCEVFYHTESFELVREENAGRCVACGIAAIVSISTAQAKHQSGRNYEAGVTTLADYRSKEGQVVIFEGRCVEVRQSRRGSDYAVMFENKSWRLGFKLVVFRGATVELGGPAFLLGLAGKQVRVRGLIVNHPRFGYEIIVNDRAMILGVK